MRKLLLGLIAAIAAPACANAAPPSGLYGKSVIVGWTETRSQRNPGDQAFRPMSIPVELSIYVSEKGNIFRRIFSMATSGAKGAKDRAGASGNGGSGAYAVQFQGNSMVANLTSGGYGSRIQVSFDAGFAGCTAQVIAAKQAGAGTIKKISPATGAIVEIESVSAGSASCSIKAGNTFAN